MGLYTLIEAGLLFVNALTIIDEDRFLKPRMFFASPCRLALLLMLTLLIFRVLMVFSNKVGLVPADNQLLDNNSASKKMVDLLRAMRTVMTSKQRARRRTNTFFAIIFERVSFMHFSRTFIIIILPRTRHRHRACSSSDFHQRRRHYSPYSNGLKTATTRALRIKLQVLQLCSSRVFNSFRFFRPNRAKATPFRAAKQAQRVKTSNRSVR
jgi:hypothetical protein